MSAAHVSARRGRRLVIVTTSDLAPGYRLAGVATLAAPDATEAADRLRDLLASGEDGIIAVHEPFLQGLDQRLRRHLEESASPWVVALPTGDARAGASERRARLMRLLWQAVGYQITFQPGDSG